jgi:hypothetical protein
MDGIHLQTNRWGRAPAPMVKGNHPTLFYLQTITQILSHLERLSRAFGPHMSEV